MARRRVTLEEAVSAQAQKRVSLLPPSATCPGRLPQVLTVTLPAAVQGRRVQNHDFYPGTEGRLTKDTRSSLITVLHDTGACRMKTQRPRDNCIFLLREEDSHVETRPGQEVALM